MGLPITARTIAKRNFADKEVFINNSFAFCSYIKKGLLLFKKGLVKKKNIYLYRKKSLLTYTKKAHVKRSQIVLTGSSCAKFPQQIATENSCGKYRRRSANNITFYTYYDKKEFHVLCFNLR